LTKSLERPLAKETWGILVAFTLHRLAHTAKLSKITLSNKQAVTKIKMVECLRKVEKPNTSKCKCVCVCVYVFLAM
jgi:hypothetical protein